MSKYHVFIELPDGHLTFGTRWNSLSDAEAKAWRTFRQLEDHQVFGSVVVLNEPDGREHARYLVQ